MSTRLARFLLIPLLLAAVATAGSPGWIRVRRGDTLSELALKYGTTVEALRALNGIGGNNLIFEGQQLRIGRLPLAPPQPTTVPQVQRRTVDVVHLVVRGDNLTRIANRYHTTNDWIARRNKLPRSRVVVLGTRLVVGTRTVVVVVPPRLRTPERVTKAAARALVVREARRAGVDAHLAVALALQESGLQQHVVSSVGAIGIMQVMPRTGEWVSRHLAGRPLDLRRAEDNVVAGIRYLALLLKVAKSPEEALAGYYQGLASVRRRGMYADTKAYVKNILALRQRLAART